MSQFIPTKTVCVLPLEYKIPPSARVAIDFHLKLVFFFLLCHGIDHINRNNTLSIEPHM